MLLYFSFIFLVAYWFGQVEIQIEGPDGWAKNLPTWRIEDHWLLQLFWGGRAMTGYHAWVMTFVLFFFHIPYFFSASWSWSLEFRVLGGFILFWAFEDFLWFVLNPKFGVRRFKKEFIPWHPRWFLGAPVDYWFFIPLGSYLVISSYPSVF